MPASKANQRAVAKYMKENYDEIKIRVYKGERDKIKLAAAAVNQSVNEYIRQAVSDRMNADADNK